MSRTKKKRGCNPLFAILIIGCLFLAILVVGLFGGKIAIEKWLQGDGLQKLVQKAAAEKLAADLKIDSFAWKGKKVNIEKISAHGYEEAQFAKFDINASRAQLKGFSNQTVTVSDINVTRAHVEISNDRLKRPAKLESAREAKPVESSKLPGFLKRFAPKKVELGDIIIGTASLRVLDEAGEETVTITDSGVQISPDLENQSAEFMIKKGKVLVKDAPEMNIIKADMRWQDKSLFVKDAGINIYGEGHVAAAGEVDFNPEEPMFDLNLQISSVDIKEVVPDKWKNRISGTVRGPVKVKGPANDLVQEGTIYLDDGVVEGIKMLQQLATFTKSDLFSRIVLNEAQSEFTKRGDNLLLHNINIHSNGILKIEGKILKQGENMSGLIQLGVAPRTIRLVPGAADKVFTESREGLVWTPVTIGGTTDKVTEDLSRRLITAAASGILGDKISPELANQLSGLLGLGGSKKEEGETEKSGGALRGLIEGAIENNVNEESDIGKALKKFGPLFNRQ